MRNGWCILFGWIALTAALFVPGDASQIFMAQAQQRLPQGEDASAVEIIALDYRFTPAEFKARPGRTVRVILVNGGKRAHNIVFKLQDRKATFDKALAPGEKRTLEFTAPGPGVYTYECPVHFHGSLLGMKGRMIVEEPEK